MQKGQYNGLYKAHLTLTLTLIGQYNGLYKAHLTLTLTLAVIVIATVTVSL